VRSARKNPRPRLATEKEASPELRRSRATYKKGSTAPAASERRSCAKVRLPDKPRKEAPTHNAAPMA
jgi:hypothetical protein